MVGSDKNSPLFVTRRGNEYTMYYTAFENKCFVPSEEPVHHNGFGTVEMLRVKLHWN
ncbi:MAG: hypothetical protein ACLFUC_03245 [Bacteroidales bacterium]